MNETPTDRRYTKQHEWARDDEGKIIVGISDYAQEELGDVVFVDLPESGKEVKCGDSMMSVESVKAVSDIYAPVDGVVTSVNDALQDSPELVNQSPYLDGWMVVIEPKNREQLNELLDAGEYQSLVEELSK